jgi:hypothetical protein
MTLAIAHRNRDGLAVLDCIREVRPPFSPEAVVEEFAGVLRSFRISTVRGDRYAGEWPRERFAQHGVSYEPAEHTKGELYLAFLPMLNSRRCQLLDLPRLAAQLIGLERRTARGGRDSIDHPPGAHDDVANAAAGVLVGLGCSASGWLDYYRAQTEAARRRLGGHYREPASTPQQADKPLPRGDTAPRAALPDAVPADDTVRLRAPVPWACFFVSAPDGAGQRFTAGADAIVVAPTAFRAALERAGCVALASMETGPGATSGCGTAPPSVPDDTHIPPRRGDAGGQRRGTVPLSNLSEVS